MNGKTDVMGDPSNITITGANVEMDGIEGNVDGLGAGIGVGSNSLGEELEGLEAEDKETGNLIKRLQNKERSLARKILPVNPEDSQDRDETEVAEAYGEYSDIQSQIAEAKSRRKEIRARKKEIKAEIAERGETTEGASEVVEEVSSSDETRTAVGGASSSSGTNVNKVIEKELQGGTISIGNISINADSVNMQGGGNIKFAGEGEVKAIEGTEKSEDSKVKDVEPATLELDDDITLTGASLSAGEIFKNLGGLEQLGKLGVDLFQGLGGIGDGLYVDGDAPTKERETIAGMLSQNIKESAEKRKENTDRMKDNWAHNKTNISIMTDKYMSDSKFREQYSDKPEAYIRRKAEEKAKSALKDMSEYVPYGVTDVSLAYELYDSANKNAFTPEQSIKNRVGYEQFNNNVQNVVSINNSGTFERNNYATVEEAIPNARKYYDAGYTNINDMAWVEKIAQSLGRSPEFAMKVDQTLRKKGGKINYNGTNEEMKKLIADINSTYGG